MKQAEKAAAWVYTGVWGALVSWFRVPEEPPTLPAAPGETLRAFKPDLGFVRYQKFIFWIMLGLIDGALTIIWLALLFTVPLAAILAFVPYLILAFVPDLLAYIAIHLRYDTTWYVISARSLRIRRGIWVISETTITFESIQNVDIHQGPLQRHFGIASLVVHTAGGGGGDAKKGPGLGAHVGILQGIANASELRDLIMERAAASRSAGLGDDARQRSDLSTASAPMWTEAHVNLLKEIRDRVRALGA